MAMENGDATPQGTPTRDGNNTDVRVSLDGSARMSSGKKTGLVKDQLTLVEARGPKGEPKHEICHIDEDLSFDKGFFLAIRAIQLLKKQANGRPVLVGIAGPSGAGKTVFCQKIQDFMPGICVLSMDMYNDASMLLDGNFDDPRLTDYDLLMENLADLKAGKTIEAPVYSFKESRRVGTRTVECPESNVIIVEGIYALSDKLRPLQDLRVSISGGVHFDLVKRVMRDIDRSGQAPEDIIHQISETVYPMYKAFIEPDLRSAHLRVVNSFNPFAGFQDPTYILKSDTVVTPEKIREVLDQDGVVETSEHESTDIYLLPPHEDPETCTSWLRMRNRDGHYTLMFEETVCDGDVMISPRIKFEVGVRILGGLMALGYEVGAIMKRRSREWSDELLSVKIDWIEGLDRSFTQIQGKVRAAVVEAASKLGLDGTYIPHSYIEQVQLEEMTEELRSMTAEMRDKFVNAARRSMDPPGISRSSSGMSDRMLSSGQRGRRAARDESVTRLQDAARRRRGDGSRGPGSRGGDADWLAHGEHWSVEGSPPGAVAVNGGRARRLDGRPPTTPKSNGVGRNHRGGGGGGDHSGGSGSGGEHSSGDEGRGYAGSFRAASPFEASLVASGAIEMGGVNRLEGRLNLLSQRVDDLAQAYNRAQAASPSRGEENLRALMQSQARLEARMEARGERDAARMMMAAAGGAAAAALVAGVVFSLSSRK